MRYYERRGFGIRPVTQDDLSVLAESRNDPTTWQNLTNPLPVFPHTQQLWLDAMDDSNMYFIGYIVDEELPKPGVIRLERKVSLLRLTQIDWINRNACVGLDVFPFHRSKGYGQELFDILVEYCFVELNLTRLWLLVLDSNAAAINVYKKVGFQKEGIMRNHIFRKGAYMDYVLMGLLREEYRADVII